MTSLLAKLVRRPKAPPIPVTFYTRVQCCCCDNAKKALKPFIKRYNLVISEVDVDTDPALVELFGLTVPVIKINDKIRFKGIVNPVLLQRLLEAESSANPTP